MKKSDRSKFHKAFLDEVLAKYNDINYDERAQHSMSRAELEALIILAEKGEIEVNKYEQIDVCGFKFDDEDLSGLDLFHFIFKNCSFFNTKFNSTNIHQLTNMAREDNIDLTGINLEGQKLDGYNLQDDSLGLGKGSITIPYNFSNLNMQKSNFNNSSLKGAIFEHSNLEGSDFSATNMMMANFNYAKIGGSSMIEAKYDPKQFLNSIGAEEVIIDAEGEKKLSEIIAEIKDDDVARNNLFELLKLYIIRKKDEILALILLLLGKKTLDVMYDDTPPKEPTNNIKAENLGKIVHRLKTQTNQHQNDKNKSRGR